MVAAALHQEYIFPSGLDQYCFAPNGSPLVGCVFSLRSTVLTGEKLRFLWWSYNRFIQPWTVVSTSVQSTGNKGANVRRKRPVKYGTTAQNTHIDLDDVEWTVLVGNKTLRLLYTPFTIFYVHFCIIYMARSQSFIFKTYVGNI